MKVEDCLMTTYPFVHPYDGIKTIENRLNEKGYIVVMDEKNKYLGILTPLDILNRPHNLVIDCLTPKEIVQTSDSVVEIFGKFNTALSEALPVFQEEIFLGILEKSCALEKLKSQVDKLYRESIISQEVKTAFLRNLSHEVRTPLNQVLGFMNIIAKFSPDEIKSEEGEQYFAIIKRSSEQFLTVMNDLIELSLINSGDSLETSKDRTVIELIFSDLKTYFEIEAQSSNYQLKIDYHNPDSALTVFTDGKK
ncbi:MAG: histidine kinase dimerization/phospho-acceptor domain-containing protein [Bacteroidales bacterium]